MIVEYISLSEIAEKMGLSVAAVSNYTTRREPYLKIAKRRIRRGSQALVRLDDFEAWRDAYEKRHETETRGRKTDRQREQMDTEAKGKEA